MDQKQFDELAMTLKEAMPPVILPVLVATVAAMLQPVCTVPMTSQGLTLRRFRDNTLASTWYGRAFIRAYYAVSPTLVKWFGHTAWFKNLWRGKLDALVRKLQSECVEDTPYSDKIW